MANASSKWSDAPINRSSQDRYGRRTYATRIIDGVHAGHDPNESRVIGLVGPWGSGKTSLVNLVVTGLETKGWKISHFTPWATQSESQMLQEFYSSIFAAIGGSNGMGDKLKKSLGGLLRLATPATSEILGGAAFLAGIPGAGKLAEGGIGAIADALLDQKPWCEQFQEVAALLRESGDRIIVVVDDIDRLQPSELHILLKVVRLLGRFPGVTYLLAYDDATIAKSLSEVGAGFGPRRVQSAYMEKIVQHPYPVPSITGSQILQRLNEGLDDIRSRLGRKRLESVRLGRLSPVFRSLLSTPRSLERYIQSLTYTLPMLDEIEVDEEDLILLTLLKTSFPAVYAELPLWRNQLISGTAWEKDYTTGEAKTQFSVEEMDSISADGMNWQLQAILNELFPALQIERRGVNPRGVGSDAYFDRYFLLDIPVEDVSNTAVQRAVDQALDGNAKQLLDLLTDPNNERAALAIEKARELGLPHGERSDKVTTLLSAVSPLLDSIPETGHLFLSPRSCLYRWTESMIRDLCSHGRADQVRQVLETCSLDMRTALVYSLMDTFDDNTDLESLVEPVANECVRNLELNLRQQDDAEFEGSPHLWLSFLRASPWWHLATEMVEQGLRANTFRVDDVAARCVREGTLIAPGAPLSHTSFDAPLFAALVPQEELTQPTNIGSEYSGFNRTDSSWEGRRIFASAARRANS